ncbi:hypothetical protein ACWGE0_13280 [Lentzea sp. NPDC054927]
MSKQHSYFAIVGFAHTVEEPFAVVRTGGEHDESFSTNLKWERTDLLERINEDRVHFEAVPISEEEGKAFEEVQAQRVRAVRERDGS